MVGIFPNDAAVARQMTAVVVEFHDEWALFERHYLSEESMANIGVTQAHRSAPKVARCLSP